LDPDLDPGVDPSPILGSGLGMLFAGVFSSSFLPLDFMGAGGDIARVFKVEVASFLGLIFFPFCGSRY